jgi:hypothetical protein
VFLTRSSHNKGPITDWTIGFYCPKVPLSIGTTLGALGSVVPESVFHTRGSNHPITPDFFDKYALTVPMTFLRAHTSSRSRMDSAILAAPVSPEPLDQTGRGKKWLSGCWVCHSSRDLRSTVPSKLAKIALTPYLVSQHIVLMNNSSKLDGMRIGLANMLSSIPTVCSDQLAPQY